MLQKNKYLGRLAEDMYSRLPYVFMRGKALAPINVLVLLTYRCNLRCNMCYYYNENEKSNTANMIDKRKADELSYDQIIKLIDDIAAMGVKVLTLHGGEPLIYENLFPISKYAVSKGLLVNFFTNGILLNEAVIDKIIDARINTISISVDGPADIHDRIRGAKGAYDKIIKGIGIFKRKEKEGLEIPRLLISTSVSAMNQDGLPELLKGIKASGLKDWNVGLITYNGTKLSEATKKILGMEGPGQGDIGNLPDELINLDPDKMLEVRGQLIRENSDADINISFPSVRAVKKYGDPAYNEVDYCLFPWARAIISPYGEVFPCILLSNLNADMGNIKDKSFKDIWNGEKYVAFRKLLKKKKLLPVCSKCCAINDNKLLK